MKKVLGLVLALMMIVSMFAVSFAESESAAIRVCLGEQPETLDPQLNSASDGSNYIKHMFEGLMKYAWDGSGIEYGLAASHVVSEDGMTWTFTLRDGLKWSDGKDLTADDVVFSFRRLVDPEVAAPYGGDMGSFILNGLAIYSGEMPKEELGIAALDEKTVEVKLQNPCGYFEAVMAFPAFSVVREDVADTLGSWVTSPETMITNGAYQMESWVADSQIVLVPNPNYYDADKVVAQRIEFVLIGDQNAKLSAIRSGELHWTDDYPREELEAVRAEGLYNTEPQLGTYYVNFNNQKAPFDNVLVRKAFALAIDPVYMAEAVTQNTFLPATNFVGPGFVDADGTTDFSSVQTIIDRSDYEANKIAAQEALAEAGYPGGEGFPTVEYATNVASVHLPTAESMAAQWKEVLGVNVEINTMDWSVFLPARRDGEHQMARDGWVADFQDPSNLLALFVSTSGNNSTQYNNPEFDALMEEVAASTDPVVRMAKMHEAEMLAVGEEFVCIPVYYYTTEFLARPEIKNVTTYVTGEKLFFLSSIEE